MAQIIWTEPARADLDEIAEYIASDNSDAASRLIRKILETVERLGAYPKSGRYLPELGKGSAYREVIVGLQGVLLSGKRLRLCSSCHEGRQGA